MQRSCSVPLVLHGECRLQVRTIKLSPSDAEMWREAPSPEISDGRPYWEFELSGQSLSAVCRHNHALEFTQSI